MTDNLLDPGNDTTPDPNKNFLEELVGEGKKFKTPEDLARGKAEADSYIKILERKSDELRTDYLKLQDEYSSRAKLQDLVEELKKQQLTSSNTTQANEDRTQPELDLNKIEGLVSSKIQQYETSKRQAENFELVRNKIKERFGSNYQDTLKQHMESLDLSEEDLNDMARNRPKFLLRTLGLDQPVVKEPFQSPVRSSQKFVPSGAEKRTWSYYQKLKKENPKLYNDPKTNVQMQKDYIELGDAFEDGDFRG